MKQHLRVTEGGSKMPEYCTEYLKHNFTEEENRQIATDMARSVSERQGLEDEKKAVMDDYKGRISKVEAAINNAATKLNNGYEMRAVECEKVVDYEEKRVRIVRCDTGEIVKDREATHNELQLRID